MLRSKKSSTFAAIMRVKVRHISLLLLFVPLVAMGQDKIMVIADPHVMASSLVEQGTAFDYMLSGERKMLDVSEEAFAALVDTALLYKPSLVLIPGDLTKDSELASHDVVVAQLNCLEQAGIPVLVVPGNHDIDGMAYAYFGEDKVVVESLKDSDWESKYAKVYARVIAKDPYSHSYVAEPLNGVTILGIDGGCEGIVSNESLDWLLDQADNARVKGHVIIAICHWQVLEHVDEGGVTGDSNRLSNADVIRDELMAHGVRVLLTGHVHVNSISTYRDTLTMSGDSIVEVSTGSPITYPCSYRWLTISADRSQLSIQTESLSVLAEYNDLQSYSREWMKEHVKNMIPAVSARLFDKASEAMTDMIEVMMQGQPMGSVVIAMLNKCLPQTDEEKINVVKKYLENALVDLYLLHSEANEPEHPDAESLAQAMYVGVEKMVRELTDDVLKNYKQLQDQLVTAVLNMNKVSIQSLVEDRTHLTSIYNSDRTDDLHVDLVVNESKYTTSLENLSNDESVVMIHDVLGRSTARRIHKGLYIENGKKIIKNNIQ